MTHALVQNSKECEILVNITHACNLRCRYCFVDEGLRRFGELNASAGSRMAASTREACAAFIRSCAKDFERVTLHFYGGEPCMAFDEMADLTEKTTSAFQDYPGRLSFAITTNGCLIDDRTADFFDRHRFAALISCDGPPEVHNLMRVDKNGAPTFQKVENAIKLLKSRKNVTLGLSAVIHNHNRLITTYRFLERYEPDFIKAEYIRVKRGDPMDLNSAQQRAYHQDLSEIAEDVIACLLNEVHPKDYRFTSRILQLWRNVERETFCGAGKSVLGIATNGDVYPCTLLVGESDCRLGDVFNGLNPRAVRCFLDWHSCKSKDACRFCNGKTFCGGGCAAMWKTTGRGFCEYILQEIQLARHIYRTVNEQRPEALALLVSESFYNRLKHFIYQGISQS